MAGSLKDLARYRFEKAQEQIKVAELLLENGSLNDSMNRAYYAIFHAIRAVNALDGFDSSKHSGVIAHFNQYHVRTGDFDKETSKIIHQASELREQADYEDFFIADRAETIEVIEKAKMLIAQVGRYLEPRV